MRHEYKDDFYEYINAGSLSSARVVCPLVVRWLAPKSLLDVGCGAGAWCRVWLENGVSDVLGVDGDYVDPASLLVPREHFRSFDLATEFDAGRRFDLVVSLEVAEHVARDRSETFVDNLTRHGSVILFSAAVPGQGGEFHVNERPLEDWRALFRQRGYRCFDPVRPLVAKDSRVEPWYRYNTLLYATDEAAGSLPSEVLATEIRQGVALPEVAPWSWRTRNAILRQLPDPALSVLVKWKHAWGRMTRPGNV